MELKLDPIIRAQFDLTNRKTVICLIKRGMILELQPTNRAQEKVIRSHIHTNSLHVFSYALLGVRSLLCHT